MPQEGDAVWIITFEDDSFTYNISRFSPGHCVRVERGDIVYRAFDPRRPLDYFERRTKKINVFPTAGTAQYECDRRNTPPQVWAELVQRRKVMAEPPVPRKTDDWDGIRGEYRMETLAEANDRVMAEWRDQYEREQEVGGYKGGH